MKKVNPNEIRAVMDYVGCKLPLAQELVTLAGGDSDLVIECAMDSKSLSMTKAGIIDARISKLEARK